MQRLAFLIVFMGAAAGEAARLAGVAKGPPLTQHQTSRRELRQFADLAGAIVGGAVSGAVRGGTNAILAPPNRGATTVVPTRGSGSSGGGSSGGCSSCRPTYTLRVRMNGRCTHNICFWYTDRNSRNGVNGCWDISSSSSNLVYEGTPVSLDERYDVHYQYGADADEDSTVMKFTPIKTPCWTNCKVPSGYEATFDC